jgi:hypothetical protein
MFMKKSLGAIVALGLMLFMIMALSVSKVNAQPPYPLNSMYVVPSSVPFDTTNASVGTLFNVTVWAYIQNYTFTWQVNMTFNPSLVWAVAAGFTGPGGVKSAFFGDQTSTTPGAPQIDNVTGFVYIGETLIGTEQEGQNNASLFWTEFEIVSIPNATITSLTDAFNITHPADTFFLDPDLNAIPLTFYDATYSFAFIPEFTSPIVLIAALFAMSSAVLLMRKKIVHK